MFRPACLFSVLQTPFAWLFGPLRMVAAFLFFVLSTVSPPLWFKAAGLAGSFGFEGKLVPRGRLV